MFARPESCRATRSRWLFVECRRADPVVARRRQGRQTRAGEIVHGRLYRPPHPADVSDPARNPLRRLCRGAVRAGRAGRARACATLRRRHRRLLAHLRALPAATSPAARRRRAPGADAVNSKYRGAQGLDPDFIKNLEKQFGFDKPAPERFALMVWNYARFDFGKSYFRDVSVHPADQGEAAGLDLARPLADAADLHDLDPARHPQGGRRRLALRHLDLGGDHRRLCDPRLPVRDPA